ncbi:hypothetical protein COCSUDRAFT_48907 [Coccomyxa subellipsoidea C-169]|uniref:ENT domain-containing protein n=1 Tax=Coccomyxa subellipsoidea (strain C-169) TaxID=574566 RepID=I0YLP8_COCSC|nr:hypothetical protein COCSUDRAFT_48907 [Coccomyxa subellipsoidea C-169]EIE19317.1 hypothetical protein COCSUDRAFT_48907 [Coccomyxa subellipsoidea C-169]|eukprot:XP_005643861.1 hypothetical protein COCSUDRAFT_48907 [Coccomyxa subellipsoidea C-169]
MALSQLQSDAYRAVLRAVATTQMDWSKEKLLTDLRKELQITTQEHFEVLTAVMQDKEIEALRENKVLEPQAANVDAGLKRKKDTITGRADYNKKLSKKPRHLELTDSPLDTPTGTPLPVYTPLDPPHQHRGPGRPSMRQGGGYGEAVAAAAPGSGGYEAKRPPGRPPGSGPGSAEPKRGPGRPPVRLSTQPSLGGRTSKRKGGLGGAAVGTGTTPYGTNELVGRKIWRSWPEEANPWSEGIITDYKEHSDEHCIVYKINTPEESYEWFRLRDAKTPEEYKLVDGYAEDMRELVSGYQAKVANQGAARQRHGGRSGKRGPKSGGRGRPTSALVKTQPLVAAVPEEPLAQPTLGAPYGRRYLAEKLRSSGAGELQAMIDALNLRAAEIGMEMQTLEELERGGLDPAHQLQLQLKDLAAREKAIHAQLAALNNDDECM